MRNPQNQEFWCTDAVPDFTGGGKTKIKVNNNELRIVGYVI